MQYLQLTALRKNVCPLNVYYSLFDEELKITF